MASDRVPTRCCVACRAQAPKGSLAAQGDQRDQLLLERALRCRLGDEDYERVAEGLRGALERLSKTEE